jgi:hypothetical protein
MTVVMSNYPKYNELVDSSNINRTQSKQKDRWVNHSKFRLVGTIYNMVPEQSGCSYKVTPFNYWSTYNTYLPRSSPYFRKPTFKLKCTNNIRDYPIGKLDNTEQINEIKEIQPIEEKQIVMTNNQKKQNTNLSTIIDKVEVNNHKKSESKNKKSIQVNENKKSKNQVNETKKSKNQVNENKKSKNQVNETKKFKNQVNETKKFKNQVNETKKSKNQVNETKKVESIKKINTSPFIKTITKSKKYTLDI